VAALPLTAAGALAVAVAGLGAFGFGPGWLALAAPASLVTYLATGWLAARPSRDDLKALVHAPRFVLHKLAVYGSLVARRGPSGWERTAR
jgi:hypothetical protein